MRGFALTAASKYSDFKYDAKMFMPAIKVFEDPCCGSL